jgi:hypothetical protein
MSPVEHIDEVPGQPPGTAAEASEAAAPASAEVHTGRQIPIAPLVCFVSGGNVGDPGPKSRIVGSPVSQTHPLGQSLGVAPMTQSSVQKPEVPDPVAQKHAPLVVSAVVQASPGIFVRARGAFGVHSPMSGSQL